MIIHFCARALALMLTVAGALLFFLFLNWPWGNGPHWVFRWVGGLLLLGVPLCGLILGWKAPKKGAYVFLLETVGMTLFYMVRASRPEASTPIVIPLILIGLPLLTSGLFWFGATRTISK